MHDNNKLNESTKENRDDVTRLYDEIGGFCIVNSNNSLDKKFVDTYATNEQAKRDAEITRLLRYYYKIITKYVFPQNEEEYITHIVKSIQDNDLKNKKANIKSSKRNT